MLSWSDEAYVYATVDGYMCSWLEKNTGDYKIAAYVDSSGTKWSMMLGYNGSVLSTASVNLPDANDKRELHSAWKTMCNQALAHHKRLKRIRRSRYG